MKRLVVLLALILFVCGVKAIVRPASLFNDGMVLQQQTEVKFWGRAKANARVTVKGSWNGKTYSCKADAEGRWQLMLPTPKGSYTPYSVTLSDGKKTTIKNVLIGEVWFASGQSNMEMMVYGFGNCPVENSARYLTVSLRFKDKIRLVTIPRFPLRQPAEFVDADWKECTPENVRRFSAVGYFFATQIAEKMDVPVGIICNAWGGTRVECWLSREVLEGYGDEKLNAEVFSKRADSGTPMAMFNGMVKPLAGYGIRGFLWYQGERNVWQHAQYAQRFGDMIRLWRKEWNQGELPFLFVEIAPYQYNSDTRAAMLREAQCDVQHNVENAYMVCTNDLVKPYETTQIHPCMKFEVGERLSLLALSQVYGVKGINAQSPEFQKMEVKDGKAILSFRNTAECGFNRFADIQGFEIRAFGVEFCPAVVRVLNRHQVEVSSPLVKTPEAVRYCFKDFQIGNFGSGDNLPLIPFRTDR